MAVLEFLSRTARAWIISTHLLIHMYRHLALWLTAVCHKVSSACVHLAHVRLAWLCWSLSGRTVSERNVGTEKERKHILVHVLEHLAEEVEALELVDEKRILLLICRILH